jgi:hypothetical protein
MCARLDVRHGKKGVKKGKRNPDYKEVVAKVADLRRKKTEKKEVHKKKARGAYTYVIPRTQRAPRCCLAHWDLGSKIEAMRASPFDFGFSNRWRH